MKPILFNTEMVRAILSGRKSVTRWAVKPPYYIDDEEVCRVSGLAIHQGTRVTDGMPYPDAPYRPGNILYVRETWAKEFGVYWHKADVDFYENEPGQIPGMIERTKWCPSIHMPKEAARLFLRVTDVKVERLHDASPEDIANEGVSLDDVIHQPWVWHDLWDRTIKKADLPRYGWASNPYVWCVSFEKISKEEASVHE